MKTGENFQAVPTAAFLLHKGEEGEEEIVLRAPLEG